MADKIGAPRYYVEEMLGRSGLVLKKELEDGDKTICYYGLLLEEEGHWEYIFDKNDLLLEYRELEEVSNRRFYRRLKEKLEKHIVIGEHKSEIERKIKKIMFLDPIGSPDHTENGISQKYGMKNYDVYEPSIIVYYDKNEIVIERKLICS